MSWISIANTQGYFLNIYFNDNYYQAINLNLSTTYSISLQNAGTYRFYVSAYGSNKELVSDPVILTVCNLNSDIIIGLIPKVSFGNNEVFCISWNDIDNAKSYIVDIYKGSTKEVSENIGTNTSFSRAFNSDGIYMVYITAILQNNEITSSPVVFTINLIANGILELKQNYTQKDWIALLRLAMTKEGKTERDRIVSFCCNSF